MLSFIGDKLSTKLGLSIILVIIIYAVGIFFYTHVEQWSILDTVYFITVTMATVGYGDVYPKTDLGRVFTIGLIWFGVSTALFVLYSIAEARERVIDPHLMERLKTLRSLTQIKRREGRLNSYTPNEVVVRAKTK